MSESVGNPSQPKPDPELAIVELCLEGHLTHAALRQSTIAADRSLSASKPTALLVDCSRMTGYDAEARQHFVDWNRRVRGRVRRLAVVTERPMWHLVVSGMALASGQVMKAFSDRNAALSWLQA